MTDHPVRVLVSGRAASAATSCEDAASPTGISTRSFESAACSTLSRIRYVLYEANGKLSVLREDQAPAHRGHASRAARCAGVNSCPSHDQPMVTRRCRSGGCVARPCR